MPGSILSPAAVSQVRSWRERRLISWSRSAATLRITMDSFPMSVSYLMFKQKARRMAFQVLLYPRTPDIYSCSFPEARLCGPPPRDVRGLVTHPPPTPARPPTHVRATQQLSVKTTFNYQLQLAVSTTTRTRRQNYYQHQKRMRTEVASC